MNMNQSIAETTPTSQPISNFGWPESSTANGGAPTARLTKSKHSQDAQRLEELVSSFSDDVFRYAYWLSQNRQVAEDLTQETFLRAFRFLDSLRNEKAAKGWLFTIVRREHARLYARKRPKIQDNADFNTVEAPASYDTSTEAFVLRQALENLHPKYREPLILQVIGGLSSEEIGDHLNLSRAATITRLFRARSKLREMMDGDNPVHN